MRNVSLALSELDDAVTGPTVGPPAERLRTASESMQQMAHLLKRWMRGGMPVDAAELYWRDAKIGEALSYARRNIEPTAHLQNIRLDTDLPPEIAALPAGPVYPVLSNGLRNAVEAAGPDGHVTVRGRREGDEIVLAIEDDGPGLAEGMPCDEDGLPRDGVTTKAGGHGIGLTLCRRILALIGGSVRLDNLPGGGAVFTIRFSVQDR